MLRNPTRTRAVAVLLSGLIHAFGAEARAASPQIANIAPLGVRRGVANEVTISGSNLAGNPRLIAPFHFQVEPSPATAKSDAANWKIDRKSVV